MRASLAAFARAGGVVYAECGGLIYLSRSIQPSQEEPARPMGRLTGPGACTTCLPAAAHAAPATQTGAAAACLASPNPRPCVPAPAAVGVFPFKTVMTEGKMTMGYVEVETESGCPLFPPGRKVRGQVYHFSEIVQVRPRQRHGSSGQGRAAAADGAAAAVGWPGRRRALRLRGCCPPSS